MTISQTEIQNALNLEQFNLGDLTLDDFLKEFDTVEVARLLYTLSTLNDIGLELTSNQADRSTSLANLLRMLLGSLGCVGGAILFYAKFKYALEVSAARGLEDSKFYLRLDPKEIPTWLKLNHPIDISALPKLLPSFVKKNSSTFEKTQTKILVPLVVKNELIGSIILGEKLDRKEFKSTDLILLSMIARQVSLYLYSFKIKDELRQANEKYRKQQAELVDANLGVQRMSEITMRFLSILDLNKLLQALLDEMISSTAATKGMILRFEHAKDALSIVCQKHIESSFKERELLPYRNYEGLSKALHEDEAVICTIENDQIWHIDAKYALFVPIKPKRMEMTEEHDEPAMNYVLAVFDKEKRGGGVLTFNDRDEGILSAIANNAAISIANVRNYELATKDSMTKLYVRRFFDYRLKDEIKRAEKNEKEFAVLIMDIDKFKHVNDTFGHQVGDQIIKMVATRIQNSIRTDKDIPSRYGGEEFTVIMPDADSAAAKRVSERIRRAVEAMDVSHLVTGRNITVSVGISIYPTHATTPKSLVELADIALYKSKTGGRNRVSFYEEDND